MNVWLQYLALILSVLAIVGLLAAGVFWKRLIDLLITLIALSREVIPLLKDMPKTMGILGRLESASEVSRLASDLLSVGVQQVGDEQTKVAGALLNSRVRAEEAAAKEGAEAGEAADAALRLSQTGKLKLKENPE